jgi:hypothetical protein
MAGGTLSQLGVVSIKFFANPRRGKFSAGIFMAFLPKNNREFHQGGFS